MIDVVRIIPEYDRALTGIVLLNIYGNKTTMILPTEMVCHNKALQRW